MDFLVDNIFKNLYITVPSIILWWALYIYFTINVYLEYVNRIDVTPHYRKVINNQIAGMMFWVKDKENINENFLEYARILYYIIHALCWPINWFYHKFIAKDIGEGVKRRREELRKLNNSEKGFDDQEGKDEGGKS